MSAWLAQSAGENGDAFVVGHRGAPEEAPENTLPSFEAAIRSGAPVVECDVRLSRDRRVVVFHDRSLLRMTGVAGLVADWRWDDLRRLDAAYPERFGGRFVGTPVPSLDELLDFVRGRAELMVEIKSEEVGPAPGGIEERCLQAVARVGNREVGFISMSGTALARLRSLAPRIRAGLVLRRDDPHRAVVRALDAAADLLVAHAATLLRRPHLAKQALAAGLALGAYPVNERVQLHGLLGLGVVSIATDRPAAVGSWLRARQTDGSERGQQ